MLKFVTSYYIITRVKEKYCLKGRIKMKYALIGCGRISPNHLEAAINNNLEIVGICDIVPENMDKLLSKLNIEENKYRKYTDFHEMLEK